MIITKEMFESFDGWCEAAIEGNAIAPLPQEYDIEYQLLVDAGKQNIADMLVWRKPQLIKASNDYTLGNYRVYDTMDKLYLSSPTFEGIENKIDEMREEFYQANKNTYISAVWIQDIEGGGEIWNDENFEDLLPNKKHRIFNFENGENVLFQTTEEAQVFVNGQIQKVKNLMVEPVIQQFITYNGGGLSGWLTV